MVEAQLALCVVAMACPAGADLTQEGNQQVVASTAPSETRLGPGLAHLAL